MMMDVLQPACHGLLNEIQPLTAGRRTEVDPSPKPNWKKSSVCPHPFTLYKPVRKELASQSLCGIKTTSLGCSFSVSTFGSTMLSD